MGDFNVRRVARGPGFLCGDDDAFFDLVRSWTSTYRHGVVSTDDFLTLIGADAAAVLKPWLYEAKLPKLPAGRQRS